MWTAPRGKDVCRLFYLRNVLYMASLAVCLTTYFWILPSDHIFPHLYIRLPNIIQTKVQDFLFYYVCTRQRVNTWNTKCKPNCKFIHIPCNRLTVRHLIQITARVTTQKHLLSAAVSCTEACVHKNCCQRRELRSEVCLGSTTHSARM
jgi:hypothetical protein